MVKKILQTAGFIEKKTFNETRFIKSPSGSFCVFNDSYETGGADNKIFYKKHDYTIELYALDVPDLMAENFIENAFVVNSVYYTKQERTYIQSEQMYQTIYEFSYTELL